MGELYFDDITEMISNAYNNLFLIAIKKKVNLRDIVESAAAEVENHFENIDGFVPNGMDGLLFFSAVAQMMDCSLFDILYLSEKEKERILTRVIDEIDVSEINEYDCTSDNMYFVYDYLFDDQEGKEVDFELTFRYEEDNYRITGSVCGDERFGFSTDYMYDVLELWEGTTGELGRFIVETIEDLSEEEEEETEDRYESKEVAESPIDYKDFFIHSYRKNCGHNYIKVMATVPIYANWKATTITFEADYCAECGVYYIPESVYRNKILPVGRLLCQVMSQEEYADYKKQKNSNFDLKPQSILNMLGYTVNAKDNLSDHQRHTILRYAIESGIISKKMTIIYLQGFIKRIGAKDNMEDSVEKWKNDLQWVLKFEKKGDIIFGVKRIITDQYNWFEIPEEIKNELPFK